MTILALLFRIITSYKTNASSALNLVEIPPVKSIVWRAGSCLAIETFSHLIGPLLKEFISGCNNCDQVTIQALCEHWIQFITLACHEDQPVDLRYSAALGLAHSSILSIYSKTTSHDRTWLSWILHFFLLCLDLLQDDDDDVREVANELICELAASKVSGLTTTVSKDSIIHPSFSDGLMNSFIYHQSYSLHEHLPVSIANILQQIALDDASIAEESFQKIMKKLNAFVGDVESVKRLLQSTSKQLSHKVITLQFFE